MKRIISLIIVLTVTVMTVGMIPVSADEPNVSGLNDILIFGDSASETAHNMTEKMTVSGTDTKAEKQYADENGSYAGGGIGEGLTYRQILKPAEDTPKDTGYLRFTLKADPAMTNYITIRLSGNQYGRGNIMLYAGDGDTTYFDPFNGREYSELDSGQYSEGYTSKGHYYYATMKIPQQIVKADGTVDLKLVPTGKLDSYGSSVYADVTQDSKYIYSIASHTEPYYVPQDDKTGYNIDGVPEPERDITAYEYLQNELYDMMTKVMSWQCYGKDWENKKTDENAFMDGAVIRNSPIAETDMSGTSDEVARRHTLEAINHQNWSTMSNLMIIANAFMFDFSKDYYNNPEMLDRYIHLLDFYQRAQDSKGGWCYFTSGEDKGKWLGASLDGTGERLMGEWWPLMSLGVDAMMQSFIQLNNYIVNGDNQEFKDLWNNYLDEKIDGDLTGKTDRTRRSYYMDMFGKLRDRLANPERGVGDFYAPTNRAGTANQDFGFAYSANKAMELLGSAEGASYKPEDEAQYTDMIKYKYGEMVDGEKWFSDENNLGLEGGASHGGWSGDYGTLLIEITNKYAESAQYFDAATKAIFDDTAYKAYESSKYFFYPAVNEKGETIISAETFSSSRKDGYGIHLSYPVAGYTATKLGSQGALSYLAHYIKENRGYSDTLRSDIENKTPHVYTRIVDTQEILKYYSTVEKLIAEGKTEPLPMEDDAPDFAWYDADAQEIVFKNNGEKGYITFNFRRSDWEYNDNTRVHLIKDDAEWTANVRSSHQGGIYEWQDSTHTTDSGSPYTHRRFDGMNEVRYGKYIGAVNLSKNDASVGQDGKTYTLQNTVDVTKAKDLISGKIYEDENGIKVDVAPRGAVLLEVLETRPTADIGVVYEFGGSILGSDVKKVALGETVTVSAPVLDGYSLIDGVQQTQTVTADESKNIIFGYETNSAPEFTAPHRIVDDPGWKVMNYGEAQGGITEQDGKIAIDSVCPEGEGNLMKTFAYKEVAGDFEIRLKLLGFDSTAYDADYFGVMATDDLDLYSGNFFEERHFSNNNNILMVTHSAGQEKSVTSSWAGDMNGKDVPIDFIIKRTGNMIEYWFSLDGGTTFEQTSKPKVTLNADDVMYVGFCMTAQKGIKNTAYINADVSIDGEMVGADILKGETVELDFSSSDADGDNIEFELLTELPEGARLSGQNIVFTPEREGEYVFTATAKDMYHETPAKKTFKVNVAPVISVMSGGTFVKTDVSPYIKNDITMVPLRAISEALGASIDWNEASQEVTIEKDGIVIKLTVGSAEAYVNGSATEMSVPTEEHQGRTFVPIKFVSETLGWNVSWDPENYSVLISK